MWGFVDQRWSIARETKSDSELSGKPKVPWRLNSEKSLKVVIQLKFVGLRYFNTKTKSKFNWIPVKVFPALLCPLDVVLRDSSLSQRHSSSFFSLFKCHSSFGVVTLGPMLESPLHDNFFTFVEVDKSTRHIAREHYKLSIFFPPHKFVLHVTMHRPLVFL
jgi:hypothetical protein